MSTDKDNTQSRLDSLKAQIRGDSIQFNADDYLLDTNELPDVDYDDIEPPIDYKEKREFFKTTAENEILSIIGVYIKDDELLKSARLISKTNNYIRKYTSLLDILDKYETNLITIQESIDMGDKSKDQFELINKTGAEISKRLKDIDELLEDCENFFEDYNNRFGIQSEEEEIISKSKDDSDDDDKMVIISMAELADKINETKEDMKKREQEMEDKGYSTVNKILDKTM